MLDTLKVLFILTGASTYLVTKYIRVGVDDKNETIPYLDPQENDKEADVGASTEQDLNFGITTTLSSKDNEYKEDDIRAKHYTTGDKSNAIENSSSKYHLPPVDNIYKNKNDLITTEKSGNYSRAIFHINDVQDNPSAAGRPTFEIEIKEEDSRNLPKRLLQVTVTDEKHESQSIVYTLTGHGVDLKWPTRSKFAINSTTGEIYALQALDRDLPSGRPQWKLAVVAEDERYHSLIGYADVIIKLKDINDNSPYFQFSYLSANVTENGTVGQYVTTVTAIDLDDPHEGSNAKLTYTIEDNKVDDSGDLIFTIDPQTGTIRTAVCCLDRESHSEYIIKVVATDGGGLKGTTTVTINVLDINDMPPKFSKSEWFVTIDEIDTQINSEELLVTQIPILIVTVIDLDLFETNQFIFKIVENNKISEKFSLTANSDSSASLKVIKPLDYEDVNQRNINLMIGVSDNGFNFSDRYHTDYCVIHVRLRDINDNSPQFVKSNIDISISEDTTVGSILTKFHAIDTDRSGLSAVNYAILRQSDKRKQFSIDSNGIIRLQRPLDREKQSLHKVLISATDDGMPPQTSIASLTITVDDVNDNAPILSNDYLSAILENSSPQIIGEIFATDLDDRTKGNGPPFTFKLDPKASDVIRDSFKVQFESSGDGKAIIYSRTPFDREVEKQYLLPIIIKDNGFPAQTATSTLTVVIGDVNDNHMRNGWKKITIFYIRNSDNMVKKREWTQIGRVNVDDSDDWDLNDKVFHWLDAKSEPNFDLDQKTGIISIKDISKSDYELKFTVFDRIHKEEVKSVVNIEVKDMDYESVVNSGSIRISGITALEFISVWNWKTRQQIKSLYERVKESFKRLIRCDSLEIFSVSQKDDTRPVIDVRYYAERQHSLLSSFFVNAIIEQNRAILENELQINIIQIGINECMDEESPDCESNSCDTELYFNETNQSFIDSNYTSFVGINVMTKAKCFCKFSEKSEQIIQSCDQNKCLNGGTCLKTSDSSFMCKCPEGANGPNCEVSTRSFNGQGWVWMQSLGQCSQSHISVDILTQIPNGLILYFGPMNRPSFWTQEVITDFISLELSNGLPRFLCDFGSGTQELVIRNSKPLNDGEWHTIEIFFDTQTVRLMIDHCIDSVIYDSEPLKMDRTRCENVSDYQFFNERLNINAPLQVGGVSHQSIDKYYNWTHKYTRSGFTGCVRNLMQNNFLFDFGMVLNSANSLPGCSPVESKCKLSSNKCRNGKCLGTYNNVHCECDPGFHGSGCERVTSSKMFKQQSFISYNLTFNLNPYSTDIQLLFRTRQTSADLIRFSSKDRREYCILEIREARVQFRYNLNHFLSSLEQILRLENILVNDGDWHLIQVKRFGSTASVRLDGGRAAKFATIDNYLGLHQLIKTDNKNIVIGGDVKRLESKVIGAEKYCLNDIRIDGHYLTLDSTAENALFLHSREVLDGCPSNNPCLHITCDKPFICHDIWMMYECRCPNGFIKTTDGKSCEPIDECVDDGCMKDQRPCRLATAAKLCSCADNSSDCKTQEEKQLKHFNAVAITTFVVCVLNIPLIIILVMIYFRHKRRSQTNCDLNENQIEDNIILTEKSNLKPKRVCLDTNSSIINYGNSDLDFDKNLMSEPHIGAEELADIIRDHIERIDFPIEECDNVCVYALEGAEDTVCSLSSLSSMSSIQYNVVYTTAGSPRNSRPLPIV